MILWLLMSSPSATLQGRRNKGGKGAAALPILLNYDSKDPFLPHQYSMILVACPTNIRDLLTPLYLSN